MKSYTITVNGTAYEVTVEETRKRFRTSSCSSCSSSKSSTGTEGSSKGSSGAGAVKGCSFRTWKGSENRSKRWTGCKSW